jgi:signal-transduction protein with cAMP-binding, CBS, and nucleotidyltransferase domain
VFFFLGLQLMLDRNIHHVFTMNKGDKRPAGIITLTDILRIVRVYQHPSKGFVVLQPSLTL